MTSRLKILGLGLRQMVERIFHRCRSSIDAALDMSRAKQVDWTERCWSQTLGSANWRARLDHTLMIMIMIMIVLIMIMIMMVMIKLGDDDRRHRRRPMWRPLPHSLTAAFDRFFDESTQLAYFLYKLCTLTLIDAFLSNVLLENTSNYQSTSKQSNLPLLESN